MSGEIVFLVRQLSQALEQNARPQVEPLGLSTAQASVLCCVLRREGVCASELHRQLGVSKAALSATLKSLRQGGYLEVALCPGDDRKKQLLPTPRARALGARMERELEQQERRLCRGLTRGQQRAARQCLRQMLGNLGRPAGAAETVRRATE